MNKSTKHKTITIGSLGVYIAKERCFFYAPWMRDHKNTRVSVFGDLFDKTTIHVHDSITGKFLGIAKRNRVVTPEFLFNKKLQIVRDPVTCQLSRPCPFNRHPTEPHISGITTMVGSVNCKACTDYVGDINDRHVVCRCNLPMVIEKKEVKNAN